MKRLAGLDGLRGLLAIGVALSHSYSHFTGWHTGYDIFHNPDYAVDIFFILSGIVLYHSYNEKLSNRTMTSFDFIVTRFFRLYPLHLLAIVCIPLALYFSSGTFFPSWVGNITPFNVIGDLTLTNSLGIGFLPKTNIPSWSISVEMFAGTLILLLCCTRKSVPWVILLVGCALAYYIGIDVKGAAQAKFPFLSDGVIRCVYCMSAGVCAYQISMKYKNHIQNHKTIAFGFVSLSFASMMIVLFGLNINLSIYLPLTLIIAFAISMIPLLDFDLTRFLESKTLVYLGKISFSVYIMHTPVVYLLLKFKGDNLYNNVIFATLAVSLTIIISKYTLALIELPAYRFGKDLVKNTKHQQ